MVTAAFSFQRHLRWKMKKIAFFKKSDSGAVAAIGLEDDKDVTQLIGFGHKVKFFTDKNTGVIFITQGRGLDILRSSFYDVPEVRGQVFGAIKDSADRNSPCLGCQNAGLCQGPKSVAEFYQRLEPYYWSRANFESPVLDMSRSSVDPDLNGCKIFHSDNGAQAEKVTMSKKDLESLGYLVTDKPGHVTKRWISSARNKIASSDKKITDDMTTKEVAEIASQGGFFRPQAGIGGGGGRSSMSTISLDSELYHISRASLRVTAAYAVETKIKKAEFKARECQSCVYSCKDPPRHRLREDLFRCHVTPAEIEADAAREWSDGSAAWVDAFTWATGVKLEFGKRRAKAITHSPIHQDPSRIVVVSRSPPYRVLGEIDASAVAEIVSKRSLVGRPDLGKVLWTPPEGAPDIKIINWTLNRVLLHGRDIRWQGGYSKSKRNDVLAVSVGSRTGVIRVDTDTRRSGIEIERRPRFNFKIDCLDFDSIRVNFGSTPLSKRERW